MALVNKRITELPERSALNLDDFTVVDGDTGGTAKYNLSNMDDDIGNLKTAITTKPDIKTPEETEADLYISDINGNVIAEFVDGHFRTKNFDSSDINTETDTTLTEQGVPADSKTVGDRLADIDDDIETLSDDLEEISESIPDVSKFVELKTPQESAADFYVSDANGNVIAEFINGHVVTKNFDSADALTESDIAELETAVTALSTAVSKASETAFTTASSVDLDIVDASGNVILRLANGHIRTKNFNSADVDSNAVKSVNNTLPDANGNVNVAAEIDPEDIQPAVDDYLDNHPVVASAAGIVSVADYGAIGDGTTDDSTAIQNAVNANYDVYFESNKTYYLASTVTITHDIKLHGGRNTVIKTKTPSGGTVNDGIMVQGALKKTTTLTSDYSATDATVANSRNRLKLTDMTDIEVGDIIVISATDQFYSYNRQYYYLGGTLLVGEVDADYIYTTDAMPWDIENTASVSVKVYSAPSAIIENLHFVSDLDSGGTYRYCVKLRNCKNSEVKYCSFSDMDNGAQAYECVNTLFKCINLAKTPVEDPLLDHYGIGISNCTNTSVIRVMGQSANSCVDMSGSTPNMNTYFSRCQLFGGNRIDGLGMHENAYNTIVENCVLGGMLGYGTMIVKNCRFVQRNKMADSNIAITYRGSHKAEWARLYMENCMIEGKNLQVNFARPVPQNPIQAYDHVIGEIVIRNCYGGTMVYIPSTNATILSNTIQRLVLDNWRNCFEIYHTSGNGSIENLLVKDCTFAFQYWINSHNNQFCFDGIRYCHLVSDNPKQDRVFVELADRGGNYNLPSGISIPFSSESSAHYMICGKNIGSNVSNDYAVGSISGSVGGSISRNVDSNYANAVTTEGNNLAFTNVNTNTRSVYLKCFAYVNEASICKISCKLKNAENTNASAFRLSICVMDGDTKKVTAHSQGTAVTATSSGADAEYSKAVPANSLVQFYIYCSSAVANAKTIFENLMISVSPTDMDTPGYTAYDGTSRDGNGNLTTIDGVNRLMASVDDFSAKFKANFLEV